MVQTTMRMALRVVNTRCFRRLSASFTSLNSVLFAPQRTLRGVGMEA